MLRRIQAPFMFLVCLVSLPAAAQEPTDEATAEDTAKEPRMSPPMPPPPPTTATTEARPQTPPWNMEVSGYFRAPLAMGISSRPGPDNIMGPSSTQVAYGPNRTIDSSYYSFAYTRLQEQDWAEVFVHARKKHVDAAVGWMGYWFQGVAFRNPDAAWAPAVAYIALDTDFRFAGVAPNVEFTAGAFWPRFGYFEKYDTYTLGRFRQMGEQLKLTVPVNPDLTATAVQGFGAGRNGSWTTNVNPLYSTTTALDLVTWVNLQLAYKKFFDVGLHYNTMWTADPNLAPGMVVGDKSYSSFNVAHLTVLGAEANVRAPYLGHLWISPSLVHARNAWALANAGTEVLHSLGGAGVATSYLAYNNSPGDSTGSGYLLNLGFLYENTLSGIQGRSPGTTPDVTFSLFGLMVDSHLDLPSTTTLTQTSIKQLKYGADVTLQGATWLGFMLRYDAVNYDRDHSGFTFSSITPRVIVSSHFLSSERIYIQYSRYFYGSKMVLAGTWPWGVPLVAGNDILQGSPAYAGKKPDENVIKLQADVAF